MKSLFSILFLCFAASLTNAQSIVWSTPSASGGTATVSGSSVSYTSDYLYATVSLAADGQSLDYYVYAITPLSAQYDPGDFAAVAESSADGYQEYQIWNYPPQTTDPYPTAGYIVRSGNIVIGSSVDELYFNAILDLQGLANMEFSAFGTFYP